ncbi:MAG: HAMP domain-containing histidine kinase [Cyanobacteria bacterium REEB67]|nr:HAMP domain-containing histidine kinase [Cyanobacteria bacterium REEB67]
MTTKSDKSNHTNSQLRGTGNRESARFKPAVVRVGFVLILVPSVISTASFLGLHYLLGSSNKLLERSQDLSKMTLLQEEVFFNTVGYSYYVISSGFKGEQLRQNKALALQSRLRSELSQLSAETENYSSILSEQGKELPSDIASLIHSTDKVAQLIREASFSNNIDRFGAYIKVMKRGIDVSTKIENAVGQQSNIQAEMEKKQKDIQDITRIAIVLGVAISLINAVLVLSIFSKRIAHRFHTVKLNAAKIAFSQPVTEQLAGDDELAYLNNIFCGVSNKLRRLREDSDMLIQMLAHDIRSPIMAMQVSMEILEQSTEDLGIEEIIENCDSVIGSTARVLELVTTLLLLDKLETGHQELSLSTFSITDAVDDCLRSVTKKTKSKSIKIIRDCQPGTIRADKNLLKRVISTFLLSCFEGAVRGSTISVEGLTDIDRYILKFKVDGAQMSALDKKDVFAKFNSKRGSGAGADLWLGLPASKMIVELHDGLVGVTSDSATDRTIWFSIPFESKKKVAGAAVNVEKIQDLPYRKRIWKPGIARQGVRLAVLPLVLQACCLLVLNNALSYTEVLEQRTLEQSQIVAMINRLWLKGLQANANIGFFIMSGNQRYKALALQNLADFKSITPKAFGTGQNGAKTEDQWSNVRAWVTSEAPSMENLLLTTTGITDAVDLGSLPPILERAETLHVKVEALLKEELSLLSQARNAQAAAMFQLQRIVVVIIAISVGLSLSLLWIFVSRTKSRLGLLLENAESLEGSRPLRPRLEGTDEMSELDYLLHEAEHYQNVANAQQASLIDFISNEIQRPLSSIASCMSDLDRVVNLDSRIDKGCRKILEKAKNNNQLLLRMTTELLTVVSIHDGKLDIEPCSVPLQSVFNQAVESISSLSESKNIKIEVSCPEIQARLDPARMVQVLINLLANSIKFAPANSVILLKGETVGSTLRLTVMDRGVGLEPAIAQRIFEKFVKGSNQNEAAFGLGLPICKLIVESHEGKIGVSSEPGAGCTFWITLPI